MAGTGPIHRVTNANVYVGGNNFLGRVKEIDLPEGTAQMLEHTALGLQGKVEFPSGFEKFEAKAVFTSFYPDVIKKMGDITEFLQIQVRSNLQQFGATGLLAQKAIVITMTASPKNLPLGSFKQNENVELEMNLNVTYVKLQIGGEDILEIGLLDNIYKVGGVDKLTAHRANLGI